MSLQPRLTAGLFLVKSIQAIFTQLDCPGTPPILQNHRLAIFLSRSSSVIATANAPASLCGSCGGAKFSIGTSSSWAFFTESKTPPWLSTEWPVYAGSFFRASLNTDIIAVREHADVPLSHDANPLGLSANSRSGVYPSCRFSRYADNARIGTYRLSAHTYCRTLVTDTKYTSRFIH